MMLIGLVSTILCYIFMLTYGTILAIPTLIALFLFLTLTAPSVEVWAALFFLIVSLVVTVYSVIRHFESSESWDLRKINTKPKNDSSVA